MPDTCLTPQKTQAACDSIQASATPQQADARLKGLLWDLALTAANGLEIAEQARIVEERFGHLAGAS